MFERQEPLVSTMRTPRRFLGDSSRGDHEEHHPVLQQLSRGGPESEDCKTPLAPGANPLGFEERFNGVLIEQSHKSECQ